MRVESEAWRPGKLAEGVAGTWREGGGGGTVEEGHGRWGGREAKKP